MTLPVFPPNFQSAPPQYSAEYINGLLRELNDLMQRLNTAGALRGSTLNLADVPAGAYTLKTGDIYVDGNGFLRLMNGFIPMPVSGMTASLGAVTTSP